MDQFRDVSYKKTVEICGIEKVSTYATKRTKWRNTEVNEAVEKKKKAWKKYIQMETRAKEVEKIAKQKRQEVFAKEIKSLQVK